MNKIKKTSLYIIGITSLVCSFNFTQIKAMKNTKNTENLKEVIENKYKYQETINNNQTTQENDDENTNKIIEDNTIKTTKNPEITENLENTPNINNCQTKKENDDENTNNDINYDDLEKKYLNLLPRLESFEYKEFYKKICYNYIKKYCEEFIEDKIFIKTYSDYFNPVEDTIESNYTKINEYNYELYIKKNKTINSQNKNKEIKAKIEILKKEIMFTILDLIIDDYLEFRKKKMKGEEYEKSYKKFLEYMKFKDNLKNVIEHNSKKQICEKLNYKYSICNNENTKNNITLAKSLFILLFNKGSSILNSLMKKNNEDFIRYVFGEKILQKEKQKLTSKITKDLEIIPENMNNDQTTQQKNNENNSEYSENDDEDINEIIENNPESQENDDEDINKIIENNPESQENNDEDINEVIENNPESQENNDEDINEIIENNSEYSKNYNEYIDKIKRNLLKCYCYKFEDIDTIDKLKTRVEELDKKIADLNNSYQMLPQNIKLDSEICGKISSKMIELIKEKDYIKKLETDLKEPNKKLNLPNHYIYELNAKILNIKEQIENMLSNVDSSGFNKFISSIEDTYKTIPEEITDNDIDSNVVCTIHDYLCGRFEDLKDKEFYKKIYHNYIKKYCEKFIEDKDFIKTYSKNFEENKNTIASENEEINKKNYELYKEKNKIINLQNKNEEIKSKLEILEKEIIFTILDAVIKGYIECIEKEIEYIMELIFRSDIEEMEKKINNEMTYKTMEKINEIPLKSMNPAKDIKEEIEKNSKEYSEICSEKYSEIFNRIVKKYEEECEKKVKEYTKFGNCLKKIINNNSKNQIKTKLKYEKSMLAKFLEENIGIENIRKFNNYKLENIPDKIIKKNKEDIAIINKNIAIINGMLSKINKITSIAKGSQKSDISEYVRPIFKLLFDEESNILKNLIEKNNKDFIRYVFGEKVLQEEKQK